MFYYSRNVINIAANVNVHSGAIEQAILSFPAVAEATVVGIPDTLKGQLPFAFIHLRHNNDENCPATPDVRLFDSINGAVREQIGAIASLGGIIQGPSGMFPRTRSGKTLRLVLRQLVENGVRADYNAEIEVPSTVENVEAVDVARERVKEYFVEKRKRQAKEA